MEAHSAYIDTLQTAGTVPATGAETVALVLPGITVPAQVQIIIEALATWTTGATTNGIVARIRRGAVVAGALVGQAFSMAAGAAAAVTIPCQVGDAFAGDVAGQQYCLTLQQASGTANGSALYASIQATWIS